jgi:hypothetical protein
MMPLSFIFFVHVFLALLASWRWGRELKERSDGGGRGSRGSSSSERDGSK